MSKLNSLQDALVEELQDLYSSETQSVENLPKLAAAATSPELKSAFEKHLTETQNQVQRLEQIFQLLGADPNGNVCEATQGLVKESTELMQEDANPDVLDAALIASAQKVEHYEIASYGTVCTWAKELGHTEMLNLLKQTLSEEKINDETLSQIAESRVNAAAVS